MRQQQVADFVDRVLSTETIVAFTRSDPNGHLASGGYVDAYVDHWFEACDRQVGINWFEVMREHHFGYVLAGCDVRYLRPLPVGGPLTVASWVVGHGKSNVQVRAIFIGPKRRVHATARIETSAVDTRTGRAVEHPPIPARDDAGTFEALPRTAEFLAGVTGLPEWAAA